MSLILLAIFFLFASQNRSQCKWQFGSNTLDLSCLAGRTVKAEDDQHHEYTYSICKNGAGSCSGGDALMCKQVSKLDENSCYEIGRWNAALSPTYDETNGWQFEYQNGEQCNPALDRSWAPTFVCDMSTELQFGRVTEFFGSCRYEMTIRTKYACPGVVCSSGLSGGSIFIIILIVGIVVYFIVGYIIMATTVNKEGGFGDFNNNVPNRAIWCALPGLVWVGCTVTRDTIMGLIGKGGTDDGSAPLTES